MKKILFAMTSVLFFTLTLFTPANAINYYAGGKLANGFYLNIYPYWYTVDKKTDKNGDTLTSKLDMDKYVTVFGNSYYTDNFLLNVLVPVGNMKIGALKDSDSGLGDISLRAGYFLPVQGVTILPALAVKLPTGPYDKSNRVNFGDGQSDIYTELYLNKVFKDESGQSTIGIDWLFKYSFRLTNHDISFNPGDEFSTEGLITYGLTDKLRIGPSLSFVKGGDNSLKGVTLRDSGLQKLSLGGEVFYKAAPGARISISILKDVDSRNTVEGTLYLGRITIPFN